MSASGTPAVVSMPQTVTNGGMSAPTGQRVAITVAPMISSQPGAPGSPSSAAVAGAYGGGAAATQAGAAGKTKAGAGKKSTKNSTSTAPGTPPKKAGTSEIKSFIRKAAKTHGVNAKMLDEIARRESGYKTGVQNNWDSNAKKGTPSKGLFQFIAPTFKSFAASAKKANPELWKDLGPLNFNDWRQQTLAAAWAIKNGKGSHWATYGAAKASS